MTFGLMYAFAENFVLPLSHDEVVHGKGSLLARMPGDAWQQFATLRAYYALMWAHPGKKLLFMGQEFAQGREWDFATGLDWPLLDIGWHRGMQALVRDCNRGYRAQRALHERDCAPDGFRWIEVDDAASSVFAWLRFGGDGAPPVAVVANFTPVPARGLPDRPAAGGPVARDPEYRRRGLRRIRPRQCRRRRRSTRANATAFPAPRRSRCRRSPRSGSSTTAAGDGAARRSRRTASTRMQWRR